MKAGEQNTREALDWPEGAKFTFADEPGEHDPCYVVMPSGNSLPVNHHNTPGVDIARAKFIVDACNEKLAGAASVDRAGIVPLDVILFCPKCKAQHIDKAEPDVCEKCGHGKGDHFDPDNKLGLNEDGCAECESAGAFEKCQGFVAWLNPPHKKHRCHECNHVFKPAMIQTNGVAAMEKGNE